MLTPLLTHKVCIIENSYQSSLTPQWTYKSFAIASFFQSSLTLQLTHKVTQLKALSEPTDSLIDTHSSDDDLLTRRLLIHVSRAVQGCLSEQHLPFILSSNILLYYNFFSEQPLL